MKQRKRERSTILKSRLSKLALGIAVFLLSNTLVAQPELGECEQEVDEVAQKQVPRALKAWKVKNWREAERYLKKAVSLDNEYADGLYLLGELYVMTYRIEKAEVTWSKLLEVCPDYKPEVQYFLGSILLENGKRPQAIALFEAFLKNPERDRGFDKEVKRALEEAQLKEQLLGNPIDFNPRPIKGLSTPEDEYLATISPDQLTMFFTRRAKKVNRRDGPAVKVRMVEEFSTSGRLEDGFEKGQPLPSPFNESYNEGGPTITADNTELYFTVCQNLNGYKNCDIYYSQLDGYGYWTIPVSVGDHINRRDSWESQASVSANGDALYFASNREGGFGELDIYRCLKKEDGSWGKPKNLGPQINTKGNEKTPFIHSDSRTLYFTSDGLPGLGGFDIFHVHAPNDSTWEKPQNIGYPINSKDDDLGLFVSLNGSKAYFASNKIRQGMGWDIFEFDLPEKARPEAVSLVSGTLKDENEEPVEDATVEIKNLATNEVTRIKVDKETGNFARVVKTRPKENFILTVEKKGSAFSSKYIAEADFKGNGVVKASLEVASLQSGREYKLNDINFASNSYALDGVAKAVIDEFIEFLKDNPNIKADIQGHTDNVGGSTENLTLSRNRARTVYEYAVKNGISSSRLTSHGYGENRPIATNDSEEGRARNRRTVFVITSGY